MASRLAPVFAFLFAATTIRGAYLPKIVLFCVLLLAIFPTGVPRFLVAAVYIPLLFIFFPKFRNGALFAPLLLALLLILFPFLDQFRYTNRLSEISLIPESGFFFLPHFDAYENFLSAIETDFTTGGYQLLGVILFFVPRAFWPDKPVGSGHTLAEMNGYVFKNISMPYLGEGYVNFGFLGVIVFALFMGFALGKGEKMLAPRDDNDLSYRNVVYFFLFGSLFFILRGDLLSSFSYFIAGAVMAWAINSIMRFVNFTGVR